VAGRGKKKKGKAFLGREEKKGSFLEVPQKKGKEGIRRPPLTVAEK